MQENSACYLQSSGQVMQAAENQLFELEAERAKLHFFVQKYGLTHPLTLQQSRFVDKLILLQMKKN